MKTKSNKIISLFLALVMVVGMIPMISITADAAYTTTMTPFMLTATVNCKCGKDAGVSSIKRVSYSENSAIWTYDIKVEWWCSDCYKNYSYTWSDIAVTCNDCEKGTPATTMTKNLDSGVKISLKFWRDAA